MTVAPEQAAWKSEMACSIAFFWADEPSPFSVPVGHLVAAVVFPLAFGVAVALLSEPQADRASVPTRAAPVTLANRRRDWIFTVGASPKQGSIRRALATRWERR